MAQRIPDRRGPGAGEAILLAAFCGYLALSLTWHLVLPGSRRTVVVVSDALTVIGPAAACVGCALAARSASGRERTGWLVIAAGVFSSFIAEGMWSFYEVVLRQDTPYPSLADIGYSLGTPLLVAGVIILSGSFRALTRPDALWDAFARTLLPAGVVWHFVIDPILDGPDSVVEKSLSAWYPLSGLVLLVYTAAVYSRLRGRPKHVVGLLALAHMTMLSADTVYAWLTAHDDYQSGSPLDFGWILGYSFILAAAWLHLRHRESYATDDAPPASDSAVYHVAPVVSLVAVAGYSVVAGAAGVLSGDPVGAGLCVAAALAVGARQVAILIENRNLTQDLSRARADLETRVRERTLDLSRLETIVQSTPDLIGTMTLTGEPIFLNRAGRRMMGLGPDQPLDGPYLRGWTRAFPALRETLRRDRMWTGETTIVAASGDIPVSAVVLLHGEGEDRAVSAIMRDITDRKDAERELQQLAHYDSLTGLLNRHAFELHAETVIASGERLALLFIDLDGFKYVNDSLGHRAGDDFLRAIASCIHHTIGETGAVARLGGDEFAVLLVNEVAEAAVDVAEQVVAAIREYRFIGAGRPMRVTASVGIALSPAHGTTLRDLLSNADVAMYSAKERRDGVLLYSSDLRATPFDTQLVWEETIREAIRDDRLALVAQPIRHLRSGETHYELLLRLRSEEGRWLAPGRFLQVAERSGLIHQLDRWVVAEAVRVAASLGRAGMPVTLEVNLSGRAFADRGLLDLAREAIAREGVDATRLVFEITETAAIADMPTAREFIESLRALGCRFAIDDFGAGFSSFAYLKHLPVDFLKIDGSFVVDLVHDLGDQHLVRAMVELAHGLGKETIAEFVGDDETVAVLVGLGVDYAQGYHIGEPRPISEVLSAAPSGQAAA